MTSQMTAELISMLGQDVNVMLNRWIELQLADIERGESLSDAEIKSSSKEFLHLFLPAAKAGNFTDINALEWKGLLEMLASTSAYRALRGASPTETAHFILSFKQVLFEYISTQITGEERAVGNLMVWQISTLLDKLALYTTEVFQKSRENIIRRQQKEILEMSTPVIKIWDRILAVPLIGTLDSARAQIVMESLLQSILDQGALIAIIDITGVPTVDTQTAQHLMKTVLATRLLGAECIISGIRPQIAQTIVQLGIDIGDMATKATMRDALRESFDRIGCTVSETALH